MRGLPSFLVIAAVWLAPVVVDTAPLSPSDAFVLAVVRDDGVMLPVATHDRGRWRTPWPGPAKEAEVPVRFEDCPLAWWGLPAPPREWTLHVPGESPRLVTADRISWVQSYCRQQVVLHSRAATRPLLRTADGLRAPKYGVAVAGPAQVELPRAVAPESSEARTLMDALQSTFNREERLMLARDYFAAYTPSVDADSRDRMPVGAITIHEGAGQAGSPTYFVELERRYPRRQPAHLRWCDEVTYMAGWVRSGGDGRLDLTPVTRAVTSCLLDTAQRATPLAVVRTPRGPAWLLELSRPDFEVLGIFLAPEGEKADPLVIREIGRCEAGHAPQPAPRPNLPDVSVP
jgi:hypothetical protein